MLQVRTFCPIHDAIHYTMSVSNSDINKRVTYHRLCSNLFSIKYSLCVICDSVHMSECSQDYCKVHCIPFKV